MSNRPYITLSNVPMDLHQWIKDEAKRRGVLPSVIVLEAIRAFQLAPDRQAEILHEEQLRNMVTYALPHDEHQWVRTEAARLTGVYLQPVRLHHVVVAALKYYKAQTEQGAEVVHG